MNFYTVKNQQFSYYHANNETFKVKIKSNSFTFTDMPIVTLQLGAKLNPNDIEEGDDVYFDCLVRANPPAYKVVWEHNVSVNNFALSVA